jgi:SAM-dependent methyltransferase
MLKMVSNNAWRDVPETYNRDWVENVSQHPETKSRNNHIFRVIKRLKVKRVLDVGCGTGSLVGFLNKNHYQAYGIDILKNNIDYAREHYGNYFNHVSVYDINYFKRYKGYYELIILNCIYEHLEYPTEALKTVSAALRNGGYILILVPNNEAVSGLMKGFVRTTEAPDHRWLFTPNSLKTALLPPDINLVKCFTYSSPPLVAQTILTDIGGMIIKNKAAEILGGKPGGKLSLTERFCYSPASYILFWWYSLWLMVREKGEVIIYLGRKG